MSGDKGIQKIKDSSKHGEVDLSKVIQQVYKNKADIEKWKLENKTVLEVKHQVEKVMSRVEKVESKVNGIETTLNALSKKIDGIRKFFKSYRRTVVGTGITCVTIICGGIWTSLNSGLKNYREDKILFETRIIKTIDQNRDDVKEIGRKIDNFIQKVLENTKK